MIDNFCPKSNLLNLCTLDIAVHSRASRHLGQQRPTTRYYPGRGGGPVLAS